MSVKKYTALILITITLSSCSQRDEGTLLGNILGAGLGALVGFQFGSGVGGALSIAGGTIIGGLIGGEIANQLTENEQKEYGKARISKQLIGQVKMMEPRQVKLLS